MCSQVISPEEPKSYMALPPQCLGLLGHPNYYPQWKRSKEGPVSQLTTMAGREAAGFLFSPGSPLRLNNSNMNELMTVRASAVWLLLAWNWYKYYQERFARDDGVMMSTSEDNSAECHRHHPHTLSGLEITGRKKAGGTQGSGGGGKVTIYIQPVKVSDNTGWFFPIRAKATCEIKRELTRS